MHAGRALKHVAEQTDGERRLELDARAAQARRPAALQERLAAHRIEQHAALHAARSRALERLADLVGRAALVPDVERHVDALVREVDVADDRAQDGFGTIVQHERRSAEHRHAGRVLGQRRDAAQRRRQGPDRGHVGLPQRRRDFRKRGVERVRTAQALAPDRPLAEQQVRDHADVGHERHEQQPGEGALPAANPDHCTPPTPMKCTSVRTISQNSATFIARRAGSRGAGGVSPSATQVVARRDAGCKRPDRGPLQGSSTMSAT
jgi:hypothetical protein